VYLKPLQSEAGLLVNLIPGVSAVSPEMVVAVMVGLQLDPRRLLNDAVASMMKVGIFLL
jgi:hypothetical protein